METTGTGTRKEQATILCCCILGMSIKRWFCIVVLVLLFVALCVAVFAGEPEPPDCDLQSGLAATLNLSQTQCENIRQLTDRFRNDTAITRGKIMEKRLELRRLSEDQKTNPYAINKVERELNTQERELSRKAHRTEIEQRRLLTPEQIGKMKGIPYGYGPYGYGPQGYGRRGYGRQ
ncbi:MAG: periplasmic heavy metal sensor [Proteobacteria bacterium]|nr:periplasmic heavy metal sensor [Pseudomonadota bacterium]